MEKMETLLATWRAIEPQPVALGSIKEDPAYQPRIESLPSYRDRGRQEKARDEHVAYLTTKLDESTDLDPVLVARVDGRHLLIDGHHRIKAYRRAGRRTIPARIKEATHGQAVIASKGVNCDGLKLPMHPEQRREAAWQYLAHQTRQGRRKLPKGESLRGIGRLFDVGRTTLGRMEQKLATVNPSGYSAEACDPGTGWPQWRHVRGNATRDAFSDLPADQREAWRDEKRAKQLGKIIDRDGLDAFLRSLRLLEIDEVNAAAEALAEAAGEPEEDFY